jgi:hypothetical protein
VAKYVQDKIIIINKYQPSAAKVNVPLEIGSVSDSKHSHIFIQAFLDLKSLMGIDFSSITKIDAENPHIKYSIIPVYNFENRVCGLIASAGLSTDQISIDETRDLTVVAKKMSRRLGLILDV